MTKQEESENKISSELLEANKESLSIDYFEENKEDIDNVLDLPTREEILEKYRVIWKNKQVSWYQVLEDILDLPTFMYLMEKAFLQEYRVRWTRDLLSEEIISKYWILGEYKSIFEKLKYFWVDLLKTWMDADELFNFLKNVNISKLEKHSELFSRNKKLFSFKINRDKEYRELISIHLDKYIYLKENILDFSINSVKNEAKVINSIFYEILKLDNLDIFIDLVNELEITNVNDEWFDTELEMAFNMYRGIFNQKQTINNLKLINKRIKKPLKFKNLYSRQAPFTEFEIDVFADIFLINTDVLNEVLDYIPEEKLNFEKWNLLLELSMYIKNFSIDDIENLVESTNESVSNILWNLWNKEDSKIWRTQEETFKLIKLLYSKFWDNIWIKNDDIILWVLKSKINVENFDKIFFEEYKISWKKWIIFLKTIFSWPISSNLENYNRLSKEIPEIFQYEVFWDLLLNLWDNKSAFLSISQILNKKNIDNFIYVFKKFSFEIINDFSNFLLIIKDHINLSGENWIWLKNIKNVEDIFWINVLYNDFIKSEGIFLVWIDLKNRFKFLNKNFPWKIKSLDDLKEFYPFYSNFKKVTESHEFFINKLSYKKNDFHNNFVMKELSALDETAKETFEKLEKIFWLEVLLKYIWKKENIANALLYSEKLISIWESAKELLLFIWEEKDEKKYKKLNMILNIFYITDEINIDKITKILKLRGINTSKNLINAFNFTKSLEEEKEILDLYDDTLDDLINLKPINDSEYKFLVNWAIDEVYNWVKSYTPERLDDYEDKTEHLEKYKFDRNWYKMFLSWLTWFKLKKWEKVNVELMKIFDKRVEKIKIISKDIQTLKWYILKEFEKNQFKTKIDNLEALIIQYLKFLEDKKWKLDIEDMDVILAYQLLWKFDSFINWSNDKIARIQDKYSENVYKLEALINEYWDNLKETINLLEKKLINWDNKKDLELLGTRKDIIENTDEYKNLTKNRVLEQIVKSFINIPDDKLNLIIIKKSLTTRFSTILQKNSYLKNKVWELVSMFDLNDFRFLDNENNKNSLKKKLNSNVFKFLSNNKQIDLDLKMIQDIQWEIYTSLKHENDKYEEVKELEKKSDWKLVEKSSKIRNVIWYFAKRKEQAKARGVWWVCIWKDHKMWQNPNYFEFVLMDIDRKINIWTTMLLHIEDNNKKYLLFWPNPSEEFTTKVSAKDLYYQILRKVSDFAEKNWYDWIILNTEYWRSTNRWWSFQTVLENSVLTNNNWEAFVINLQKSHLLWWGYYYKDWLNFVWKKTTKN